ncbi:MAG: 2-aminoethylphosphonate aminotransferase, partial [Pseudomonadota bacterium]
MSPPRKILLTPGPATTSERVKRALVISDLCPREMEFGALVSSVRAKLCRLAGAAMTHSAVLLGGSGTAAVEMVLSSVVGPADRLLIVDNGVYGRRAEAIARAHQLEHRVLRFRWGAYPDPGTVLAALENEPRPTHCFLVHHETSTGMLNPLPEIAGGCRERGVTLIVDAISSVGGRPLDLAQTPVDFLVGSANKCLQGMPGLAFVLARRDLLRAAGALAPRSVYLDLHGQWSAQETSGQFLYTPPVQVVNALDVALDELAAEGAEARHRRYAACHRALLAAMQRLGFQCLLPEAWHSGLVTAFLEPEDPAWSFQALHDYLRARDVTIYPGVLPEMRTFRVGNLGDLNVSDI